MRTLATTPLAVLAALAFGACATAPPPIPPPPFSLTVDHFAGTVLTGPIPGAPLAHQGAALEARLSVSFVEQGPSAPAPALARQVFLEAGGDLLRSHAEVMSGIRRVPQSQDLPGVSWVAERPEALPLGATVSWTLQRNLEALPPSLATWEAFEVQASRAADAPRGVVVVALVFGGEHFVLAHPPAVDGEPLQLLVPAPTDESAEAGLLLELALRTPLPEDDDSFAQAARRAESNLARARALARTGSSDLSDSESFQFELDGALQALRDDHLRRPALVFLARETEASFTGDLALTSDDATFSALLRVLREHLDEFRAAEPTASPADIGWFLDATAFSWIAQIAEAPETELAPELHALLLIHTGQLGRYPDLVEELASNSTSLAQFNARLIEENQIFLEDAHPAARVRALAWLQTRAAAPRDFDPLGSRAERRAALAAAEAPDAGTSDEGDL